MENYNANISEEIVARKDSFGQPVESYFKKQVIGRGGFARCYLLVNLRTGEKFAGKVIRPRDIRPEEHSAKIAKEVDIHW